MWPNALLGLGDGEEDDQQGHADPVIQAALDVEALADAGGSRLLVTTGSPRAASVGARAAAVHPSSWGKQDQPGQGADHDRQGQAEAEQPRRQGGLAPQPAQVDPGGVGEQHQGQGGLGQQANVLVGGIGVDQLQDLVADQQAEADEDHRLGDHRGLQPPRQRPIANQQHGNGR
jgi:hypothetical protein